MSGEDVETWAVRLTHGARVNINEAWNHFAETADEDVADAWQQSLEKAIAALAHFPRRHPLAPEAGLFGPPQVHRLLCRRTQTGPAYHIYYRVYDRAEAPADAPFVRIIAIRHAAMAPLTEANVRFIATAED